MNFELLYSGSRSVLHTSLVPDFREHLQEAITTSVNAVLSIIVTCRDHFQTEHHVSME